MNAPIDTLSRIMPSANPGDLEIAAWEKLPRDEQLRRLQAHLTHSDCATPSTASMADIRDRARAAAKSRHG